MANDYSRRWFSTFLDTIPAEATRAEVDGVCRLLPQPLFQRILDVCCGPGRHSAPLAGRGYDVTGVDRDGAALARARAVAPTARFVQRDMREIGSIGGTYDAALLLWQSFGYFDAATNDDVLVQVRSRLRRHGRLLLDLYHREWFENPTGNRSEHVQIDGTRWASVITYDDATTERFEWELFTPDELAVRAEALGFTVVVMCAWYDPHRPPHPDIARFQAVLERV